MSEMKPSDEHADSVFYGIAVEEVQAGRVDKGLMAKAIAKAYGDKKKAEVLYLEWRVGLLKEQAIGDAERAERKRVADEAKAAEEAQILREKRVEEKLARERKEEEERNTEYQKQQRELPFYKKDMFNIVYIFVFILILLFGIYLSN